MLSERLRALTADLMRTVGTTLGRTGLSPSFFTGLGFVAVAADSVLIALGYLQLAGVLLIASLLLDSLDGAVARATGRVSAFGGFLDSTLDRWAEVALFFGMGVALSRLGSTLDLVFVYWAVCGSMLVSYTRARAESIGVPCKEGLFTRFERMVVMVLGLLTTWLGLANAIIALLATLTALQRLWYVWRQSQVNKA
ncbi:MAG: CDP-alcohol phosphatidyltransferase family protein [Chloroflexi bacterium]|nr:MAG: CDP-alcohol phosphatidyltransferase family protein [Chloroflexota bacterium]